MNSVNDIKKMAVIGAGIMGHGIAEIYALNGYTVSLMDINNELLEKGIKQIKSEFRTFIDNEIISENESEKALNRISTTVSLKDAVDSCNYVTEAVTENLELKRKIFNELEKNVGEDAILASNTSGLMISNIAEGLKRPERVIGTHFSVPPHIVPGVEIIRGKKTSDYTFNIAYELIKKIGKIPFVVKKEIDGFILNRLQFALAREALNLIEKGIATPEDIDICLNSVLGFRWVTFGPFRQFDSAGIDSWNYVGKYLLPSLSNSKDIPKALADKFTKGEFGMKTGKGFFDYSNLDIEEVRAERDKGFLKTLKLLKSSRE